VKKWYSKAAVSDTAAQLALGQMHRDGIGVTRNRTEALRWFRKAADAGSSAGQYSFAMMALSDSGGKSGKVEIDAPHSRIALRKVIGDVAITTESGKISMTETTGKINIKADHSTIISRSTDANSIWLNGRSNSIEFSCARIPKNTVTWKANSLIARAIYSMWF